MTDIYAASTKSHRQLLLEVQLNHVGKNRGLLHAYDVSGILHVATSSKFGGEGKEWSPEHLFLGSISSCYMSTYLTFARKIDLEITHFDCNAIGQIDLLDGMYRFTHINLYPKVYIPDESLREKASLTLRKTQKNCLVGNSLNISIIYHGEVLIRHQDAMDI